MPARVRAALAAAVTGILLACVPSPATADPGPGPTAGQVAASKAEVAAREQQVEHAASALGTAQARFQRLNNAAEMVVEKYNEAAVKLAAAQRAADTANQVLTVANRQVAKTQRAVTRFARNAYESGGMSTMDALLAPGGARSLVRRVGAIDAVSVSQHRTLLRLDAAAVYQAAVTKQADAVAAKARAAAAEAAAAKRAAEVAVHSQQKVLRGLQHTQAHFDALLAAAKAKSSRLQKQRIEALAQPRPIRFRRQLGAEAFARELEFPHRLGIDLQHDLVPEIFQSQTDCPVEVIGIGVAEEFRIVRNLGAPMAAVLDIALELVRVGLAPAFLLAVAAPTGQHADARPALVVDQIVLEPARKLRRAVLLAERGQAQPRAQVEQQRAASGR